MGPNRCLKIKIIIIQSQEGRTYAISSFFDAKTWSRAIARDMKKIQGGCERTVMETGDEIRWILDVEGVFDGVDETGCSCHSP
jgi:hypothetical protein